MSTNSAEQLIYKAATLLDEQYDVEGAVDALDEAISLATVAGRTVELIRAKTFLGELMAGLERNDEAIAEFEDVEKLAQHFDGDRSAIDEEAAAARNWLTRLRT